MGESGGKEKERKESKNLTNYGKHCAIERFCAGLGGWGEGEKLKH